MAYEFAQPEYLYRLAKSGTATDRKVLAQSVIGMLQTNLSDSEEAKAQEILLHLLREADNHLRRALAQQLAMENHCPMALINYLIYENEFPVAEPLLKYSSALSDDYLIHVVKHFEDIDYWRAIATRRQIGEDLAVALLETNEKEIFGMLAANPGAHLCPAMMSRLLGLAPYFPQLHESLLSRPEVTPELMARIYRHASTALRDDIVRRFDFDPSRLKHLLEKIVDNKTQPAEQGLTLSADMIVRALELKRLNKIDSSHFLDSLKQHDMAFFTCLWSALLNLDVSVLTEKMQKDYLHTLVVLCHAARIARLDFKNMFVLGRHSHEKEPSVNMSQVTDALKAYDKMKFNEAQTIKASWAKQQ